MSDAAKQMMRVEDTKAGRTVPRWKFVVLCLWIPAVVMVAVFIPRTGDTFLLMGTGLLLSYAITVPLTFLLSPHLRRFIG